MTHGPGRYRRHGKLSSTFWKFLRPASASVCPCPPLSQFRDECLDIAGNIDHSEAMNTSESIHRVLDGIPPGRVAEIARKAGIQPRALARLRAGQSLDIRASTLARLCVALGITADQMLGLSPPPPPPAAMTSSDVERLRHLLERQASELSRAASRVR